MYYCVARNFWGVISASPLRVTHAARAAAYAKDHRASLRRATEAGVEDKGGEGEGPLSVTVPVGKKVFFSILFIITVTVTIEGLSFNPSSLS